MVFYNIPGILSNSSAVVLCHQYFLIFTNSFKVFADISGVLNYSIT